MAENTDKQQAESKRQKCQTCEGFGAQPPGTGGYACVLGKSCRPIGYCNHCNGTGNEPERKEPQS